ncbi:MAG: rRNA (guanine966-N2)-methyltransferase [Acidimicrobiaceae bacterium]|nr:rRNA (guanine966-N2)-methyltransferase [Acidimicrobiaceae bacterium]
MRVVGGSARGRRLTAPPGNHTRPTSDRVRESVFNMLASLDAVQGASVADLFAGSGAMGIEALSRGAASAVFVDHDTAAVAVVKANLTALGFAGQVRRDDVLRWAQTAAPVDLAIVDPPYSFEAWPDLLAVLPAGLAVLESDRPVDPGPGWEVLRSKRYGGTVVVLVAPSAQKGGA